MVETEWDYELNKVDPDTIAPHSNKKYYWRCLNGHESYQTRVNNKVNGNGGNCPKCSRQKPSVEFSLQTLKPELAIEWDIEANEGISPEIIPAYSNKKAWWICSRCGHKWQATVYNRSNGRGCPQCAKGHHTSLPEQIVYYFIKKAFPDAINGYQIDGNEVDIFIPSTSIGIEYDGEAFHRTADKLKKDISKSVFLHNKGINLFRIREQGCPVFTSDAATIISVNYSSDYSDLQRALQMLIDNLCERFNIVTRVIVDVSSVREKLSAEVSTVVFDNSFAAFMAEKEKRGERIRALWDYEGNNPLRPEMVQPFSEKVVFWICPDNPSHRWRNTVKSVSLGYGCSKCSRTYKRNTEEWVMAAIDKHGDKYDYSKVNYINSKTLVTIICKKHGEFEQLPSEHLSGKGCKYCSHQVFHPLESLASISPDIASQ